MYANNSRPHSTNLGTVSCHKAVTRSHCHRQEVAHGPYPQCPRVPPPQAGRHPDFWHHRVVLFVPKLRYLKESHGQTLANNFSVSEGIPVVGRLWFILSIAVVFSPLSGSQFTHSAVGGGHWSCFRFGAVVNTAALNICVHVCRGDTCRFYWVCI